VKGTLVNVTALAHVAPSKSGAASYITESRPQKKIVVLSALVKEVVVDSVTCNGEIRESKRTFDTLFCLSTR
jgi:hypothetical protein